MEKINFNHGEFLYVNGVSNTQEDARATRRKIENIVGRKIYSYYNGSATDEKCVLTAGELVLGGGAIAYAAKKEFDEEENSSSRFIGALGVGVLALGLWGYSEIQEEKNQQANEIAQKISNYLLKHPYASFNLVLHSQGVDVGKRALRRLPPELRRRVYAVTLGGMVGIPEGLCKYAVNFQLNSDLVPGFVGRALNFVTDFADGRETKTCYISSRRSGRYAHSASEYLNHRVVKGILKHLAKPNKYEIRNRHYVQSWSPIKGLVKLEKDYTAARTA